MMCTPESVSTASLISPTWTHIEDIVDEHNGSSDLENIVN